MQPRVLVIWDQQQKKAPEGSFSLTIESAFETIEDARREAEENDLGEVVGFIPVDLEDPALCALANLSELANGLHEYEMRFKEDTFTESPFNTFLLSVFLAGRKSAEGGG